MWIQNMREIPESLGSRVYLLREYEQQLKEIINQVCNIIDSLDNGHSGEAMQAFIEKIHYMESEYVKLYEILEEHAKRMDEMEGALQETDEKIRGEMKDCIL